MLKSLVSWVFAIPTIFVNFFRFLFSFPQRIPDYFQALLRSFLKTPKSVAKEFVHWKNLKVQKYFRQLEQRNYEKVKLCFKNSDHYITPYLPVKKQSTTSLPDLELNERNAGSGGKKPKRPPLKRRDSMSRLFGYKYSELPFISYQPFRYCDPTLRKCIEGVVYFGRRCLGPVGEKVKFVHGGVSAGFLTHIMELLLREYGLELRVKNMSISYMQPIILQTLVKFHCIFLERDGKPVMKMELKHFDKEFGVFLETTANLQKIDPKSKSETWPKNHREDIMEDKYPSCVASRISEVQSAKWGEIVPNVLSDAEMMRTVDAPPTTKSSVNCPFNYYFRDDAMLEVGFLEKLSFYKRFFFRHFVNDKKDCSETLVFFGEKTGGHDRLDGLCHNGVITSAADAYGALAGFGHLIYKEIRGNGRGVTQVLFVEFFEKIPKMTFVKMKHKFRILPSAIGALGPNQDNSHAKFFQVKSEFRSMDEKTLYAKSHVKMLTGIE